MGQRHAASPIVVILVVVVILIFFFGVVVSCSAVRRAEYSVPPANGSTVSAR
jgi:hypothetical protein